MTDERRSADVRLAILEREVVEIGGLVRGIDAALRFPEQSPVGRALTARADQNATSIAVLRTEMDSVESVVTEMTGVVKALRIASLLLGIVVAVFTLIQVVS